MEQGRENFIHGTSGCGRDLTELSKVDQNRSTEKWHTPLIPAPGKGRQKAQKKFKRILGYLDRESMLSLDDMKHCHK